MPLSAAADKLPVLDCLKARQLTRLALLCGLQTTGTKPVLISRLRAAADRQQRLELASPKSLSKATAGAAAAAAAAETTPRILSIDLGIRNLAYSLTTIATTTASSSSATATAAAPGAPSPVVLHAWHRRELVGSAAKSPRAGAARPAPGAKEKNGQSEAEDDDGDGDGDGDAFSPARLAALASDLVSRDLLPLRPTHVLMERQRFRSGGGAVVQEWTLRVNSLEAMLHAILRDRGSRSGGGDDDACPREEQSRQVVSVRPRSVGHFWFGGGGKEAEEGEKEKGKRSAAKESKTRLKKRKIDLLARWLQPGAGIVSTAPGAGGAQARGAVQTYLARALKQPVGRRSAGSKKTKKKEEDEEEKKKAELVGEGDEMAAAVAAQPESLEEVVRKVDDLADCLLQGMAWMKWQENTRLLQSEEGVMRLLEEEGEQPPRPGTGVATESTESSTAKTARKRATRKKA